ncbi:UvrD-helicase domain-containing protein [Vibrio sp. 1403]|uniref:UvrD-helicase domain-containing protein n=1 Tax=Vibrio TaxID=662 RepID=UPI001EFE4EB6|nr:UvrD-helicase domain-containing protein [Vibrio sp. 1403]MCG9610602.1 UvrD-helicase domain-containing protein [Vibrio harveyi]MCG9668866.1 UvrD-helicase domain-containing protein [Vibrio harveyi]MDW3077858.1 UvrD-helicase domain-containing protein [Vibrio sp. 1403]
MSKPNSLIGVDHEIYGYLNLDNPKSFLLFAGAGSGKTRSLVNVLQEIREKNLGRLIQNGQRVGVITYTNAACNEIQRRLSYDPLFHVSTIHSFVWEMIKPFTEDIKGWLRTKLSADIEELDLKISNARDINGKTAQQNIRKREAKATRLDDLRLVRKFSYSPTSNRIERGTVSHEEVIQITATLLNESPLLQNILTNRYPILLIDESQDTRKELMEAFIQTQSLNRSKFSLGLFGDLMQRIYGGGKHDLESSLPDDWKTPSKTINYRCPQRVVELINSIREEDDKKKQEPKAGAPLGVVRLFIVDSDTATKRDVEVSIRAKMSAISEDSLWLEPNQIKALTLEHAMAAIRGNFDKFYLPLATVDGLRDSLLNGTNASLRFLCSSLLPLIEAIRVRDEFAIANIIKKYSGVISSTNADFCLDPISTLKNTDQSVEEIRAIVWELDPPLAQVLLLIKAYKLLYIPDELNALLVESSSLKNDDEEENLSQRSIAWNQALLAPISHLANYALYINEELGYGTHQGVKGLEFDRVMAIMDDNSANGFLFRYEKLFGAQELSQTDIRNQSEGKDSVLSRTRRLFYVICSRAEKSLAVVAYTKDPKAVKRKSLESGWFTQDEIEMM